MRSGKMFARLAGITAVVAAAALMTGCVPIVPDAAPVDGVDCDSQVTPGKIPEGFEPVSVYLCDSMGGFEDADGQWSATTVQRLEGDLDPLVEAFGEASDPRWLGPCTTIGIIIRGVWLVDADGNAIRVAYPVNGCGQPKAKRVNAALDLLTVVQEEHVDAQLQESAAAIAAGCSTRGEVLRIATGLAVEGGSGPAITPDPGMVTIPISPLPDPAAVAGLRVCRYDTDLTTPSSTGGLGLPELGTFTDATELDRDAALTVLTAADYDATPLIACDPADRYALLLLLDSTSAALGLPIAVELGGCARLSTGSGFTLASDELLALLGK